MLEDVINRKKWQRQPTRRILSKTHTLLKKYGPITKTSLQKMLEHSGEDVHNINNILQTLRNNGIRAVTIDPKNVSRYFGRLRNQTIVYSACQDELLAFKLSSALIRSRHYADLSGETSTELRTSISRRMQYKLPKISMAIIKLHYPGVLDYFLSKPNNSTAAHYWDLMADPDVSLAEKYKVPGCKYWNYKLKLKGKNVANCVVINAEYGGYEAVLKYWKALERVSRKEKC